MERNHIKHPDKELVASCFKASATTYEASAIVQKEISRNLISILQGFSDIGYSRVLEIGCCTGILTEKLCASAAIDTLFINDLVPGYCAYSKERIIKRVHAVESHPGDIEKIPLPGELDLIISSSTLQWMADLPGLVRKISVALNHVGHLAFAIFSPGTMGEINALTGRGLRYHTNDELTAMLTEHFNVLILHSEKMQIFFPSLREVLQHIRQTGVGGLQKVRWNLRELLDFERRYTAEFVTGDGFPVTYISTFVVAEKKKKGVL